MAFFKLFKIKQVHFPHILQKLDNATHIERHSIQWMHTINNKIKGVPIEL